MLDLDQKSADRSAERATAARHGARGDTLPIRWKGEEITSLPAELPLETLEPLRRISADIALLIRSAIKVSVSPSGDAQRDGTEMILDLLSTNEDLPETVVSVLTDVARRTLGDIGYQKFVDGKPSYQDVAALTTGVLDWWGVSLGDLFGPSSSPEPDGSTSVETFSDSIASTPEVSGETPAVPDSSGSETS